MGSPNERAATEEPPVVAGPAATAGRSISVPATETLGGSGGGGGGGSVANSQQQQDQSTDNGEHNGLSFASKSTKVDEDFQSSAPHSLLDGDGSSQSRKISASTNSHISDSHNGNRDSGDHQQQVTITAAEAASNGTDSDITAAAMDWAHDVDDDDQLPVSSSSHASKRKIEKTTTPLAALDDATATFNPLVFPQDEPWGGDKEPEAPEVSVTPTQSRAIVNDVLMIESDNDDIGSNKGEKDGCMGEQDSPPVSPPSSSSPTSRSSSVASVSVASLTPAVSPTTGGDGQGQEHYCLKWTNHGSHVLGVFVQLLRDESLVDVTLSAEGRSVRAHKMVLSACSSFFRTLFVQHADQRHPIIILKDTKFEELQSLIQFMYKGEVSVEYGQLATLLKSAENLRVKGLAEVVNSATAAVAAAAAARNKQRQATAAGATNNNEDDKDDKLDPIVIERTRLLDVPSGREPSVDHQRHSRLHHRRLHPYSSSRRTLHPHLQAHRASTPPTNHRRGMALVVDSPLLASTDDQHHPVEDLSSAHRQRLNRDSMPNPPTPPQRETEAGLTAPLLLVGEASQQHRRHRHNPTRLLNHPLAPKLHQQSLNSATEAETADDFLDTSPDVVDVALHGSGRHPDDNDHNHRFKEDARHQRSTNNPTANAATASMANAMITQTTTFTTVDRGDVKAMLTNPPPLALINETIAQDLRQRPTSSLESSSPPPPPPPTGSASSSTKPASNHRFSHPWMMEEESEESADGMDADDDVEDEDEEGEEDEEDEAYRHQRRTLKPLNHSTRRSPWSSSSPSATARHNVGPPQHHPMSLKKETQSDWAESGAAGTSRSEIVASAVDSLRSPGSYSSASSDYGHHIDQFSDDQMPTAEVVIEEEDYINFSGADGLSTDAAATDKAVTAIGDATRGASAGGSGKEMRHRTSDRDMANTTSSSRKSSRQGSAGSHHHSQHHHHHHQQQQQQLLLQHQHFLMKQQQQQQHHRTSMSVGSSHASRVKKPYHPFTDGAATADVTAVDATASARKDFNDEMSVVFNRSLERERERDQERHRDRDRESTAGRADISPSTSSSFFSSLLPMVPPLDFAMRFGGMQFGAAAAAAAAGLHLHHRNPSGGDDRRSGGGGGGGGASSRSGGSTPRPGPSSSSHQHPGDEERSSSNASDRIQCRDSPSSAASSTSAAGMGTAAGTTGTATASSSTTSTTTARSVASGFPFTTSISLIESHVGVGFTLGSREKPYKCEQCGQCYKYLSAFTKHKEQNHTARLPGEKPFRCEVCGMQFKYLKSFKKHRLNHAVERLHHVYPRSMPSAPRPPFPPPALATSESGSGSGGTSIGLGLAGGSLMEERSVLDMLSRSERPESHHHRHRDHQRHSQQPQDSPLALNRRSRSEERSPSSVRIKTEIEVVSSGEEESNAAEDDKSLDGSSNRERSDRSNVYCPHCRLRFANDDGLRTHISTGCPERMHHLQQQQHQLQLQQQLQQHPGRMLLHPSLTSPGAISSKFPVGNPASNFLHGALQLQRQQAAQQQAAQATLLAVNYLAARAATASGNMPPPPGLERQVPDVHDQTKHGRSKSHDGEPISDREGSEDGDGSRSNLTRNSIGPSPATSAGPSAAGPWHNLIRDFSAAAAVAAAAAAASGRPPVPPMPNPTTAAAATVLPPSLPAAAVAAAAAAASTGVPPPEYDPGRPHLCPFCGKGFRAKENLKLHIRKHTGERPFECEFCGRAFGGKSDMNRHLRIHTGERPYRCDACGKTFARADYLSKHLSTHLV